MLAWARRNTVTLTVSGALALAAGSGFLVAQAVGASQQAPASTVTIDIPAGSQGPPGPPGADGQPGAESCPTGSTFKAVVLIQQGKGPTEIWTCVKN